MIPPGKTCFLYYYLVLRLIAAEHTVFQDVEGSVFNITDQVRKEGFVEGDDVLTLVDADGDMCRPAGVILARNEYRIVLTSSPRSRKDRKWMDQYCPLYGQVLIMEPFSWEEMIQLGFVNLISSVSPAHAPVRLFILSINVSFKKLQAAVEICGNTLRRCSKAALTGVDLNKAKENMMSAICDIEDLEKAIHQAHGDDPVTHCIRDISSPPIKAVLGLLGPTGVTMGFRTADGGAGETGPRWCLQVLQAGHGRSRCCHISWYDLGMVCSPVLSLDLCSDHFLHGIPR